MAWISKALLSDGCHEEGSVVIANSCGLGIECKNRTWGWLKPHLSRLCELGCQSPWTVQTFPEGNSDCLPLMSLAGSWERWDSQGDSSKRGPQSQSLDLCCSPGSHCSFCSEADHKDDNLSSPTWVIELRTIFFPPKCSHKA